MKPTDKVGIVARFLQQEPRTALALHAPLSADETVEEMGYPHVFVHFDSENFAYACILLKQGYQVNEAAYACGFNDIPNFNVRFKKIIGATPSEFRKNAVAKPE